MKSYPIQVLFREYFEGILAAVFLALFLRFFVVSVLYIPTDSMEPGLKRGDFVIGWRLSYGFPLPLMRGERLNFKQPLRGDVVSFRFPGDPEQLIIRRVIGLPGDKLEIRTGQMLLNNEPIFGVQSSDGLWSETLPGARSKSHLFEPVSNGGLVPTEVPEGHVFVLSDNRKRLDDSRDWGFVPMKNLESRLVLIWLSVSNEEEGLKILWPRIFTEIL